MSAEDKIKIGLDFHGVITDNPEYFKGFAEEALARGHEIHVISGGPKKTIAEFLKKWGIKYSRVFTIIDFYDARGQVTFFENGEFKVPAELWDSAKAKYCRDKHIDIHIDDTDRYSGGFTTPFCFYDGHTKHCRLANNTMINLSDTPEAGILAIEKFVALFRGQNKKMPAD